MFLKSHRRPRKKPESINIEDCTKEMFEVISKAGLRCAYDLRHAADHINDKELSNMFNNRSKMWLNIFNPNNGPKNYQNSLHNEIYNLERDVEKLKKLLREKGVQENEIEAELF